MTKVLSVLLIGGAVIIALVTAGVVYVSLVPSDELESRSTPVLLPTEENGSTDRSPTVTTPPPQQTRVPTTIAPTPDSNGVPTTVVAPPPIQPSSSFVGVVDYEGLPQVEDFFPIHGWSYLFTLSPGQEKRVAAHDIDTSKNITLLSASTGDQTKLNPELEGKRVSVKGKFIKDYDQYVLEKGGPIISSNPSGQVLLVDEIVEI